MSTKWSDIIDKPETFPPEEHSHDLATEKKAGFLSPSDYKKMMELGEIPVADVDGLVNKAWNED